FALESARTAGLGYFVPGWPVLAPLSVDFARHDAGCTAHALSEQVNKGALSAVISILLEKEILVSEVAGGKPAEATVAESLRDDLTADSLDERVRFAPTAFLRFVSAAIRARLLLKHRTFEAVVNRVRSRSERARQSGVLLAPGVDLPRLVTRFAT